MLKVFYMLLNFNFIIIYKIHKMSVSLQITGITFQAFSRVTIGFFQINFFFSKHVLMKNVRLEKDKKKQRK